MEDNSKSGVESQPAVGVIYKITNTLNGKPYVGKTKQKLSKRISQHKLDSKKGSLGIGAAIRKYGWEHFTVEVIEECPVEKLNEREIFWIATLGSKAPNGYNLTDGGDGGRGCSPSPETRAKMSAAQSGENHPMYGKHHKPETCKKISERTKGEKNGFYGKHHSPETCAKISERNKGKKHSPETRAKMVIAQRARRAREKKQLKMAAGRDTLAHVSLLVFLEVITWLKFFMITMSTGKS